MAGILDYIDAPKDSMLGMLNLPTGSDFPDPPKTDEQKRKEILDGIVAQNLKDNEAAGGPPPPFAAPAQTNPGIQYALGNAPQPFGALAPVAPQAAAPTPVVPQPPVPLPQSRPAQAPVAVPEPQEATIPPNATPTQGQAPVEVPPEPSMLSKIGDKINANSNLLIGLGAGFAGAPSIGTGISRGLTGASAGSQLDIKQAMQQGAIGPTYKALVSAGVPPQQALAAVYNPTILKSVTENYLGDRKSAIEHVKSKDMFGNETDRLVSVNPYTNTSKDITGTASGGAGGIAAGSTNAVLAPGVTMDNFDHTKVGDDYLKQFQPEIQDAAKNYLAGQSIPTGRQAQAQAIKMVAQKYGNDIGMPADDSAITQRKQWANSLGNTQNGVGLQSKGFQQGLEHFSKLSDNLVKMNLSNGFGLEPVAGVVNGVKNLTTDQQELVHKSDVIGQALAREMGNLFSKNGGGVHEAAETKKNVSNATMSSKSAAGSLEAIDELMQGGLKTLEQRRDELFPGGNAPKGSQFMGPDQQAALEHIRNNIAILKGEKPATPAGPMPTGAPPPGKYVWSPDKGLQPQ